MITDIRELQQAFDDAELYAEAKRLDVLLADDFMSIGERGFQLDKQQWIERHMDRAARRMAPCGHTLQPTAPTVNSTHPSDA